MNNQMVCSLQKLTHATFSLLLLLFNMVLKPISLWHQWQGLPLGIRCNMSAFPRGEKELQLLYFSYDPKCFYINFVISCIGSKTHLRTISFRSGLLFRFRRTLVKKLHWIFNLFLPYISYLKQTEILINFYFHAIQLEIPFIRMPQNILYHY